MSPLGTRLREIREIRGQSLRGLAASAGISAAYLQKLERGDVRQPSPGVLHKLAKALEVPYADLMELAGHIVPRRGAGNASVNVLAHALSAEELSPREVEELARYLTWIRQERNRGS